MWPTALNEFDTPDLKVLSHLVTLLMHLRAHLTQNTKGQAHLTQTRLCTRKHESENRLTNYALSGK